MERNQKPLIEQNRRLSERNRLLQNEIKKGEQRLCHSQDDFLTLVGFFFFVVLIEISSFSR